jgi:hypothetical protein
MVAQVAGLGGAALHCPGGAAKVLASSRDVLEVLGLEPQHLPLTHPSEVPLVEENAPPN